MAGILAGQKRGGGLTAKMFQAKTAEIGRAMTAKILMKKPGIWMIF